jgi:hypothetical protein
MSGWLQRWSQRQHDLARGVDGDLIRDNSKRYKVAFGLIVSGLLLAVLGNKVQIPSLLYWILVASGGVSFFAGFFIAMWAREEAAFLNKPDPEEPPTIFKQ